MKKALFSILFLSVALSPGIALAEYIINACGGSAGYCTKINEIVQECKKELDCKEPDFSDIHTRDGLTCVCNPLQAKNLFEVITPILNFLFNIALVLAPLMIVVGGIMFVTAAGSPERVSTAKRILVWTVVGFGIIILARGLIVVLRAIIGF